MRAKGIVRQVLRGVGDEIHAARLRAFSAAVCALVQGGQIGLAALGRAIGGRSYKHGIKRIDRLLGNQALADELEVFYAALTRYVLGSMKRPVILLDWTEAGDRMWALTAAVPMQGRAITIYSVVVPRSQYTSRRVENAFLDKLRTFLRPHCTPILVGDAGFRAPWMKRVQAMGWDFVTRIRGRTLVRRDGEDGWQRWKKLASLAGRKPRTLGSYRFVRSCPIEAQLVVVDQRSRRARRLTKDTRKSKKSRREAESQREPWFLSTSLTLQPEQVVAIYKMRMQIELTFRDLKSHRFGWGFEDARCRSTTRVAIQILLAAVASLSMLLVGLAAEAAGLHRRYQANTTTDRRVLSMVTLGRAVLCTGDERLRTSISKLRARLAFVGIR